MSKLIIKVSTKTTSFPKIIDDDEDLFDAVVKNYLLVGWDVKVIGVMKECKIKT